MKKKILLLLLLLIPFMVKADIKDYTLKWKVEDENYYNRTYNMENTFIFVNEDELVSIDKLTGERNEVTHNLNYGRIVTLNNHILVLTNNNSDSYKLYAYDEYLNRTNKITINNFDYDYFTKYNEDYLILSGNEYDESDDHYYYVIKFIDKEGNIVKEDKHKTDDYLWMYYDNAYGRFMLEDDYNNLYIINDNYKIEPLFKNSDGSYMYLTNNHLYKMSSTGEELDSLEVPNGTSIAMKDGKYYLATGVYETNSDNKTSVGLNLSIIDENLNVLKTGSIAAPDKLMYYTPNNTGYGSDVHGIFYDGQNIVSYIRIWTTNSSNDRYDYAYILNENLIASETELYFPYQDMDNYDYGDGLTLNNYYEMYDIDEYYNIYDIISNKFENDPNYSGITYQKDGNNYIVGEYFYKCEGVGCSSSTPDDYTENEKIDLIYLDSNYNILFRKTIVDWYPTYEYTNNSSKYYKSPSIVAMPSNDYIIVAATAANENILHFYDKQGNMIKDYSEESNKYLDLSVEDIYITNKGFYVSYSYGIGAGAFNPYKLDELKELISEEAVGHATALYGTLGLKMEAADFFEEKILIPTFIGKPIANNGTYSLLLYYSNNFNVKTQVSGKGTINVTPEKADEGEPVRFTVTPDTGFVLSYVKVIDANGNVVTFTEDTFVMPASDVTIEAVFVPKNPNTGDIAILAITLFAIGSAFILLTQKKKLDFLK